jgi:hypothetical protein
VFIASISMSTLSNIDPGLEVTTYLQGNQCSQAGQWLYWLELGGWEMVCMIYSQCCISQVVLGYLPEDMQNDCNSTVGVYYSPTGPHKIHLWHMTVTSDIREASLDTAIATLWSAVILSINLFCSSMVISWMS